MRSMHVTLRLDTPDVVGAWWLALSNLPFEDGPWLPAAGDRDAYERYDRALLAMVTAGYTPTMADTYVV